MTVCKLAIGGAVLAAYPWVLAGSVAWVLFDRLADAVWGTDETLANSS